MTTAVAPTSTSAVVGEAVRAPAALTHDDLARYRRKHPAWRLLAAENCSLVLGFLSATFLEPNVRRMSRPELIDALGSYLYALRERDAGVYSRNAEAYVDEWANPAAGYLRKTMPLGSDVPVYEPTAAVELAAGFCRGLGPRRFVGTASRLLTIRDLLRQIAVGSDLDPGARIAALERQRAEIDDQLAAIRAGVDTRMEPPRSVSVTCSCRTRHGRCWVICARWRRASEAWIEMSGRRRRHGTGRGANFSQRCLARSRRSAQLTRGAAGPLSGSTYSPRLPRKSWSRC